MNIIAHIEIATRAHEQLMKKARRLKLAMLTLAVASLFVGLGSLVGLNRRGHMEDDQKQQQGDQVRARRKRRPTIPIRV